MQAGLQLWREMGNARFSAMALNFLSPVAITLDLRVEARSFLEESLRLTSTLKDRWGMGTALGQLGSLNLLEGHLTEAEAQFQQSIAIFTELGARWDMAWSWMQLGKLHLNQSDFELANAALKNSISLSLETNATPLIHEAAIELADCLLNLNRAKEASAILQTVPDSVFTIESLRAKAAEIRADVAGNEKSFGNRENLETLLMRLVRE
jgi:tetratricopeptide (TPR) repeat protein